MIVSSASANWWVSDIFVGGAWTRVASGGFFASHFTREIYYPYYYPYRVYAAQINRWSAFNNTICNDTTLYQTIGQYGFCEDQSTYRVPAASTAMEALAVTACVFLFLASVGSCALCNTVEDSIQVEDSDDAIISSLRMTLFTGFVGMVLSTASFAVAENFIYYKSFGESHMINLTQIEFEEFLTRNDTVTLNFTGGFLPIIDALNRVHAFGPLDLQRGPAYWCAVSSFIMSFIAVAVILLVHCSLLVIKDKPEKDGSPLINSDHGQPITTSAEQSSESPPNCEPENSNSSRNRDNLTLTPSPAQTPEVLATAAADDGITGITKLEV